MARARKPCEFCEAESFNSEDGSGKHQLYLEIYPENNFIGITSFATNENTEETEEICMNIEMNYCPVCGRKLEGF